MLYSSTSEIPSTPDRDVGIPTSSLPYSPKDFDKDITEVFGKLINIYGGETRFCLSYTGIPTICSYGFLSI
ncbi:hypothetical protein DITRI_Ditri17bG0057800 [Diplodiscus trichospermus]